MSTPIQALLSQAEVTSHTTLCKATLYQMIARGEFVAPIRLSPNRVAWKAADVQAWVDSRPTTSAQKVA